MLRSFTLLLPNAYKPLLLQRSVLLRTFTHASRLAVDPSPSSQVTKGTEGPHPNDERLSKSHTMPQHLRGKPVDTTSTGTTKMPTGDWVMMHPVYARDEVNNVQVVHRPTSTISDKVAAAFVKLLRFGFDTVSRYKHKEMPAEAASLPLDELRKQGYAMSPEQWLMRFLFLETVAGVPGMVAGTLRHLRSLRLMRRDGGWIHSLLEESENERMHLMTFMTMKNPSIFFRAGVLGAQGVFYNAFFLAYLLSPKTAHRFVGHLEEEAVKTYTLALQDLETGRIPEWTDYPAPEIAIDYWRMPKDSKLVDVIKNIRADEATHRFVNHSLANLNQKEDVNPFALREPDMKMKGSSVGLERDEAAEFVKATQSILNEGKTTEAGLVKNRP